jgi:hypothetical protein
VYRSRSSSTFWKSNLFAPCFLLVNNLALKTEEGLYCGRCDTPNYITLQPDRQCPSHLHSDNIKSDTDNLYSVTTSVLPSGEQHRVDLPHYGFLLSSVSSFRRSPLWSSFWLLTQRSQVRFPALLNFLE